MAKKTVENLREYWQEIATKAGIDPTVAATIGDSLGDESVARAFRQGFVPVPEHHSTLDEVRGSADAHKAELDKWYNDQALPAYQTNVGGIERLRQYEALYGELDPSTTTRSQAADLGFQNKAELDKYLDDKLRAQQQGFVGLAKVTPRLTLDYYNRFKKVLDLDEIEKISVKEGLPPDLAYERFIAPEVEAQRKMDFDAKIKEAREQGERDAVSKYHLPVETTQREASPFFDRSMPTPKEPMSPMDEDRASRSAFNEGWAGYAEEIANKHRG
jgi:hypothetical protein